jgi:hypothetical protein
MPDDMKQPSDHVERATDPAAFAHWPDGLYEEMRATSDNGCVGSVLVSETKDLRVWHLHIAPGDRCGFHRHVNPYFWSALTAGPARNYFSSGDIVDAEYYEGQTNHYVYGDGEEMIHSLENTGDTVLSFTTVEFLNGANRPLDIPESVRLKPPA